MPPIGNCRDCNRPIAENETAVYPIQGYEVTRSGGGQNHVLRKTRVDGWVWHKACWDSLMKRRDLSGIQQSLPL